MGSHSADSDHSGDLTDPENRDSGSRRADDSRDIDAHDRAVPKIDVSKIDYDPDPSRAEATPRDDLPPLPNTATDVLGNESATASADYHVRPPSGKKRRTGEPRSVGFTVIAGTIIVVVGAMAALWFLGQSQSRAAAFSASDLGSVFLTSAELPAGWNVGTNESTVTASDLAGNDYWTAENISDSNCTAVDRSFGLLTVDESGSEGADTIVTGGSAYSTQGQYVQQSARVFSDSAAATAFTSTLSDSLAKCTSYTALTSAGEINQSISRLTLSDMRTSAVGFGVISSSGDIDVVFLRNGNLVVQVMVGPPVSGDTTAVTWNEVAATIDARLAVLAK